MKKLCGWLFVLLCVWGRLCQAQEPVVIVSSDYEPYSSSQQNGSGIVLDIVRQVFAEQSLQVTFQFYPWKRCEMNVAEGNAFAATPYFKTEERQQAYNFSDPIIYSYQRFFYNKKKFPQGFTWNTLEDFRGYIMGGILGYWYLPAWKRAGLQVNEVATDLKNVELLLEQRIDFMVLDELTGRKLLQEHFPNDLDTIGMLEKPESFAEFYLLISRTYPHAAELTQEFNAGLKRLKETGAYQKLLEQYKMPQEFATP